MFIIAINHLLPTGPQIFLEKQQPDTSKSPRDKYLPLPPLAIKYLEQIILSNTYSLPVIC